MEIIIFRLVSKLKGFNIMAEIQKELIIKAAEQYGFNLEFKTSKKLEETGFVCELNEILPFGNSTVEVDLIARKQFSYLHLIIECKGADEDTILLLVKGSNNRIKNDKPAQYDSRYTIGNVIQIPMFEINTKSAAHTITGDFFRKAEENKKEVVLKKTSKNDDRTKFYKAQQQILAAIEAYSKKLVAEEDIQHVVPLIVTNADI